MALNAIGADACGGEEGFWDNIPDEIMAPKFIGGSGIPTINYPPYQQAGINSPAFPGCNHFISDVKIKVQQMEDELGELLDAIDAGKLGTAGTHVESLLEDLEHIRQALLI